LLLDVQKAGARWDPIEETIKPIPGEVARVAVCRLDQKPRYALFSIAVRRLIDAGMRKVGPFTYNAFICVTASVKMTRGRPT
jgi:hypothetical protein